MESTTTIEFFVSKLCDLWVEGFDVLQGKMSDSEPTAEMMELLQANIKGQGKEYVTQWVKDYVLKHLVDDDTYNIIKWQTGEPKSHGRYLVQTKEDGFQIAFWSAYVQSWSLYHNSEIIAWCKLSDIEPYKEGNNG